MKYLKYPESEAFAGQVRARVWNSPDFWLISVFRARHEDKMHSGTQGGVRESGARGNQIWIYIGDDSPFLSVVLILNAPSLGIQSCWWNKPTHAFLRTYLLVIYNGRTRFCHATNAQLFLLLVCFLLHSSQVVKKRFSFTETWFFFLRSRTTFHWLNGLHRPPSCHYYTIPLVSIHRSSELSLRWLNGTNLTMSTRMHLY